MKITVLIDNNTLIDRYFLAEPALSFLIEDKKTKVLFDTGYSDAFIKNAQKLGINLLDLNYIVLSHSHLDHTWGLEPLIRSYTEAKFENRKPHPPKIVAHPQAFDSRTTGNIGEIGPLISQERISKQFELALSGKPQWLTDKLVFLGTIPRNNDFEGKHSIGKKVKDGKDDFIADDSALAYKSREGLIVIAGCAHSGICNTIEFAKEVCGEEKILSVIGGFHLQNPAEKQLAGTLNYFKKINPVKVYPCHCTDFKSRCALSTVANVVEVGVGLQLEF